MNGLFHLIRKYTAIVSSALKNIPGGIINILHFPISNTTTVFSSPGLRCQTAQDSPLPQSPEIVQTSQSKPIYPALPDPFLEKFLLLFICPMDISILSLYFFPLFLFICSVDTPA